MIVTLHIKQVSKLTIELQSFYFLQDFLIIW